MNGSPQKDSKGEKEDAAFKSNTANSFQLKPIQAILILN